MWPREVSGVVLGIMLGPSLVAACQTPAPAKTLQLVTWFGPGGIPLPEGGAWQPRLIAVYDGNMRPVIEFENSITRVTLSLSLFENQSGDPDAEGCRKDAIDPLVEQMGKAISARSDSSLPDGRGGRYAVTSYQMKLTETAKNHDYFAFAGNAKVCAELHASVVAGKPDEQAVLKSAVAEFHPNLDYRPVTQDYFVMGRLLFKRAPDQAAPYLKAALDTMPHDASLLTERRLVTDQLVLALALSGDTKDSRLVAESAIKTDPTYPLNFYNLARADAESGDAVSARLHLQQAFDRRGNALQGGALPDPTADQSLLKLSNDKAFWSFVEALPKN